MRTSSCRISPLARRTVLVEHGTDARVLAAGYLIYERESTLFAMAFDERRLAVTGSPVPVQTDVQEALGGFSGAAQAAISSSGSLVFVPVGVSGSANRVADVARSERRDGAIEVPSGPSFHRPQPEALTRRDQGGLPHHRQFQRCLRYLDWRSRAGHLQADHLRRPGDGPGLVGGWIARLLRNTGRSVLPASRWQRFPASRCSSGRG